MAQIKIPPHYRDTAKEIAAKKWFKSKKDDRGAWFARVDKCISMLKAFGEPVSNKSVASMLAVAVLEEDSLADHVVEKIGASVSDEGAWLKMCTAAAWVILQEYLFAVEKGEWAE